MPNLKISQLTGGGAAQAGDEYVVARSGGNNKITGANVAAAATSVGTLTSLTVSGNLTVDTDTLFVDAANNQVGMGRTPNGYTLDITTGGNALRMERSGVEMGGFISSSLPHWGTLTNHPFLLMTNGSEKARLDASGNLGLGVTPSAWDVGAFIVQQNSIMAFASGNSEGNILHNAFYNSSAWKYIATREATRYQQANGAHAWYTAPSGTAGAAISFTQAMTLDASGNLLLGVTVTDTAGVSMANSLNYSIKESSGSLANLFRQASSAATILANGYKQSANANAFASSIGSSWAKSAISMDSGVIKFFTDTAATTAIGTDVTPTERARITSGGSLVIGTAALATSATDGFLYVPTCAGTPTGTPTTQTGTAPIVVDTTNHKLYFFSGGTWRDAGP